MYATQTLALCLLLYRVLHASFRRIVAAIEAQAPSLPRKASPPHSSARLPLHLHHNASRSYPASRPRSASMMISKLWTRQLFDNSFLNPELVRHGSNDLQNTVPVAVSAVIRDGYCGVSSRQRRPVESAMTEVFHHPGCFRWTLSLILRLSAVFHGPDTCVSVQTSHCALYAFQWCKLVSKPSFRSWQEPIQLRCWITEINVSTQCRYEVAYRASGVHTSRDILNSRIVWILKHLATSMGIIRATPLFATTMLDIPKHSLPSSISPRFGLPV